MGQRLTFSGQLNRSGKRRETESEQGVQSLGVDPKPDDLFGTGGGQRISELSHVPLIGQIPFEIETGACGNAETPIVVSCPTSNSAQVFGKIADTLIIQLTKAH